MFTLCVRALRRDCHSALDVSGTASLLWIPELTADLNQRPWTLSSASPGADPPSRPQHRQPRGLPRLALRLGSASGHLREGV